MRWTGLVIALVSLAAITGCATAVPAMVGGSTTPHHRTDIGLGGAARVPLGDLKVWNPAQTGNQPAVVAGGVVPVAYARYGLTKTWDLGLMVAGTMVRIDARHETLLKDGSTRTSLVVGMAPYGGWVGNGNSRTEGGQGGRVGLEVPFTFGVDIGSVYEFWVGARASGESVIGDFAASDALGNESGWGVRIGPVVGMALGVRRFHALVELTAAYEHWFYLDDAGRRLSRGGVALIPAFALRLRL